MFSPTKPLWWTGLLLSLGVGVMLHVVTSNSLQTEASERFRNQARNSQFNIANGIKAYTDVLRGTASFFQSVDSITRENFHRYVGGLDLANNFPAIVSINFAQNVPLEQRAAFEQHVRDTARPGIDGYPELVLRPAAAQGDAAIISLIEPLAGLEGKFGVDIAARPAVADALALSRDTGMLSASGLPIGFDTTPNRPALGMRLPVYRPDRPLFTVAQRRAAYLGSVGIGFSVHRLVSEALAEIPVRHARLTLRDVSEAGAPNGGALLYDSMEHETATLGSEDIISFVLPIDFNGRQWQARFTAPMSSLYSRVDAFLPWLALLTGFIGSMLIYALFHTLSSSRLRAIRMAKAMTRELRESQAKLQLSHHKLRRLAAHADQIKEEERKRIAREIHDDLGQNLLALRIEADVLTTRTSHRHPRLHERARCTLAQIDNTIKSVRQIINDLRPNVLDLGLSAAVEWQIGQFRQRSGIVCELNEDGADLELAIDDKCAIAFFRILQESLSNILQHAHASLVRVELRQQDGILSMSISDNGVGMHARSRNKFGSFGLVGIEERISILGGACTISGAPNAGTTIMVSVPLELQAPSFPHRLETV
ncbi:CHASE domain-containing protein [Pseudoduganella sp. LjRoot289]